MRVLFPAAMIKAALSVGLVTHFSLPLEEDWLPGKDSNLDKQNQNLLSCH